MPLLRLGNARLLALLSLLACDEPPLAEPSPAPGTQMPDAAAPNDGCGLDCQDDDPSPAPNEPVDAGEPPEEDRVGANAGRPKSVTLCYTQESSEHPATTAYWEAMRKGDLAARAKLIEDLEAALKEQPDQEEFALLLGLASLWRVAESYWLDSLNPLIALDSVTRAESALVQAYELCPTDHRIPAWLGPIRIRMGRMIGDDAMVQAGFDILQKGLDHYPGFVLFSKFLVYADLPAQDPQFLEAVAAVRENADYCGTPQTALSPDPACKNHYRAARNVQGSGVFLGDMYAKAQDKQAALESYGWAKTLPDYDTWPFKDLLEERIQTLDKRMAGAATADNTLDDLQPAWESSIQCSLCHQQ